tara:strand:- start:3370 stop:3534 length:165 start_codon:yes stop_codon:yes gene_type:complete
LGVTKKSQTLAKDSVVLIFKWEGEKVNAVELEETEEEALKVLVMVEEGVLDVQG